MSEAVKALTKGQREFFAEFAKNSLSNALFPILNAQGFEFTPEKARELIDMQDISEFTDQVAQAFLKRVEFAEVKRVDKLMKSDEFMRVVAAANEVSVETTQALISVLAPLIPTEVGFGKAAV